MTKERSVFQTFSKTMKLMDPKVRKLYLFGLFLGILDAACYSVRPLFFKYMLNAIETNTESFYHEIIIPCSVIAVMIGVIYYPSAYFFHILCASSISKFLNSLRVRLYDHVQSLSSHFFMRNKIGEISGRLIADLGAMESGLSGMMGLVWSFFVMLQSLIFIFTINYKLSLLLTMHLIIIGLGASFFLPRIRKLSRISRDTNGELSATLTEYVNINTLIKSMGREDYGHKKVRQASIKVLRSAITLFKRQFIYTDAIQTFVGFIAPTSIVLYGGYLINQKEIKVSDLVAFWGYWIMLNAMVTNILDGFRNVITSFTSADRVLDYLEEVSHIQDDPNALDANDLQGKVTFKDVVFSYPGFNEVALRGINFTVEQGKHIAFVGPSGAGKSTILTLIQRFYDPQEGVILIDDKNIKEFKQRSLRQQMGFVMQENIFFEGTIEENLRLAKTDATMEEIQQALENANAWGFVNEFTNGVHAVLGEKGARLSGGQKQRLSIARVFLKNPRIIIFDEATSALDSLSEKAVQEAMERLMKNRTTITVAHRISTIKDADEIIVIDKGVAVYRGKHQDLLKQSELYYSLASHQGLAQIEP